MISRRDALRLAAGLDATAAASVPFAVSPQEAAVMLDQPAEFDPSPGPRQIEGTDQTRLTPSASRTTWTAGVRAGAPDEHLRLAMVAPRQTCRRCHGDARLWEIWEDSPDRRPPAGAETEPCPDCGGVGTVPTPVPTLSLGRPTFAAD